MALARRQRIVWRIFAAIWIAIGIALILKPSACQAAPRSSGGSGAMTGALVGGAVGYVIGSSSRSSSPSPPPMSFYGPYVTCDSRNDLACYQRAVIPSGRWWIPDGEATTKYTPEQWLRNVVGNKAKLQAVTQMNYRTLVIQYQE